ncbi:MAG: peptide deformylase [Solobacterium sp.]|nr:peptide deformylase [Solobacterium sp.]
MIRPIMKDPLFLSQPSEDAGPGDTAVMQDLAETLTAHRAGCVGMAANMIGVRKNIIAVMVSGLPVIMVNPVITAKSGPYTAREGCLSLPGERSAQRWQTITVSFQDMRFGRHTETYTGTAAQIIQHEIDHCRGILI